MGKPSSGLESDDERSGLEVGSGLVEQAAEQSGRDRERDVGDDPIGLLGKRHLQSVALDDHDVRVVEAAAQSSGEPRIALDRHDPSAATDEAGRQRAGAGAYVEDQIAAPDARSVE